MATKKTSSVSKQGPKPVALQVPVTTPGTVPDTPANYQKLSGDQLRTLRRPTPEQARSMGVVSTEVGASNTYEDDFGKKAPKIQPNLKTAAAWMTESERARRWADYSEDMAHLAADQVLGDQETFKLDYATAVHHDATIGERYPALAAFVSSRTVQAQRAAATRKKNIKAQEGQDDEPGTPVAPVATSAPAAAATSK